MVDAYKNKTTSVKFSKQDIDGKELKDATITLTHSDGTKETWKSDGSAHEFTVKEGKYTFHEEKTPDDSKYKIATDITFEVVRNAQTKALEITNVVIGEGNKKLEDGTLVMVDAYKKAPEPGTKTTKVNFSKRALTRDGKELSGAKISLTKKDGTVVDTWVTDGTTRSFDLEDGEYTFTELSAPDKYQLATSITFTVANGKVSVGTTEISGNTIVMVDALKDKETNGSNGGNRSNNSSGNSNSGNSSQGKQTQQGYSGNSSQGKQTQQGYNNTQSSRGPAKTNDISNFMLYVGMLILSGLGLVLLSIKRRTTR